MKLLSQGSQYAISAVIALSKQPEGATVSAAELAKPLNCPAAYLSQLLSKLKPSGIIQSKRGQHGGVMLGKAPKEITLMAIIEAIDGTDFFERCFLGVEGCGNIEPCPFHQFWSAERNKIQTWLSETTFAEIDQNMTQKWFNERLQFLRNATH